MVEDVWIVRHGIRRDMVDSQWRLHARRPEDPGLAPDGWVQARETAERLAAEDIRHIFSSPFLRTVQTAHVIGQRLGVPVALEHGIGEWLNPEWFEGPPRLRSPEALARCYATILIGYQSLLVPTFPESAEAAFDRAAITARRLTQTHAGGLLLVAHGHSLCGAVWGLLGRRSDLYPACCAIVRLHRTMSGWRLAHRGEVSHLSRREDEIRFH